MSTNADNLPLFDLALRSDMDVLMGRWGFQPEVTELPACYEALAAAAQASGCRFWLQDIRRRSLNDPATTQWLLHEFFPAMAQRLGGRLYVAYLVGPALQKHILSEVAYVPPADYPPDSPFIIDFFGDEGAAVAWLKTGQERR